MVGIQIFILRLLQRRSLPSSGGSPAPAHPNMGFFVHMHNIGLQRESQRGPLRAQSPDLLRWRPSGMLRPRNGSDGSRPTNPGGWVCGTGTPVGLTAAGATQWRRSAAGASEISKWTRSRETISIFRSLFETNVETDAAPLNRDRDFARKPGQMSIPILWGPSLSTFRSPARKQGRFPAIPYPPSGNPPVL
jgi:hypothetical protein